VLWLPFVVEPELIKSSQELLLYELDIVRAEHGGMGRYGVLSSMPRQVDSIRLDN